MSKTIKPHRKPVWHLQTALEYIRKLQPRAMQAGWCVLLAGGVMNKGHGGDLDLMLYPRTKDSKREDILAILPGGDWSKVDVADIYTTYDYNRKIEFIFQTHVPC